MVNSATVEIREGHKVIQLKNLSIPNRIGAAVKATYNSRNA